MRSFDDIPATAVAEQSGVIRQTVHRRVARYRENGLTGPGRSLPRAEGPPGRVSTEIEAAICDLRTAGGDPRY